ncbi:MAG TPA: cyclic nucleotide-binding and patatin-like phospholipase domain-containing protein [Gaiellaceae bacterium]|jgi:NTE family protein|nr:cyclic nucleotide-binding and patatin-like phospholipase domain-containing protein [Gaiellaceae bacterium]
MQAVGGLSVFDGVPPDERSGVLDRLERRKFAPGEVIISAGDRSHLLFLVEHGLAEVFVADRHGVEHLVGSADTGSVLGEMALLRNEPAACTVRAATEVEAAVIEPDEFERIATRYPLVYRNLGRILADKLASADRLAAGDAPGVLIHLRDHGGPPLAAWALACSIAWHTRENVVLLARDRTRYRELEGIAPASGAPGRVELRFEDPEEEGEVGEALEALFERLATVIVLDSPGQSLLPAAAPVDLIPAGTSRPDEAVPALRAWVDGADGETGRDGVYDLAPLGTQDTSMIRDGLLPAQTPAGKAAGRLARRLTKLTVGIALGSGSMRGYAHFGVLKGLQQAGIEIDYAAGASVGSAAAALHAMGKTPEEGLEILDQFAERMFRMTLPGRGLLSNTGIRNLLRKTAGDVQIQDLKTPLAIVAADVDSHAEVVIRRGLLWQAVLASISIPGIYAAQRMGEYTLVDGGVVNPVPSSVAAQMGADIVLAVRLVSPRDAMGHALEAMPAAGRPPSAVAVIMSSIDIMQSHMPHEAPGVSTVAIIPKFENMPAAKLRHFGDGRRYYDTGLEAVQAAMPRIAASLPSLRP